jgi:hypothetical protein
VDDAAVFSSTFFFWPVAVSCVDAHVVSEPFEKQNLH